MVECLLCMQEVEGSIPEQVLYFQSWFCMFPVVRPVAQPASDWGLLGLFIYFEFILCNEKVLSQFNV